MTPLLGGVSTYEPKPYLSAWTPELGAVGGRTGVWGTTLAEEEVGLAVDGRDGRDEREKGNEEKRDAEWDPSLGGTAGPFEAAVLGTAAAAVLGLPPRDGKA